MKIIDKKQSISKTWRKVKLGDMGKVITGKTPPTAEKDYFGKDFPFITPTDITDFDVRYNYNTKRYLSNKWYQKVKSLLIPQNSTCFVCIGSTIGKICLTKGDSFTNQQINTVIVDSKKADSQYIYYLLKNNQKNIIKEYGGSGAAKAIINKSTFENIEFLILEDINEQKRIAEILSAFDDKIELNNKINQNLEKMAQAIFKEWFIKSSKLKIKSEKLKGWKVKKIGDIAKVVLGGTPSRINREFWGGKIPWINSGKVNEFRIISASEHITEKGLKKSNTQMMPKRTTVIAITGATLGQVSLLETEACANQSVVGIFGSDLLSPEFIYLFVKNKINEIIQGAAGGAQQHINKGIVENYPILLPPQNIILEFNKIIKPIFDQISNNIFENQKLSALRDLLLPKLMSGEIKY